MNRQGVDPRRDETPAQHQHDAGDTPHGGHGKHGLLAMVACCIPMVVILVLLLLR